MIFKALYGNLNPMEERFVLAFSEKDGPEALREVSLKIKSIFPKPLAFLLLFFTPHYSPLTILKTINFTLSPEIIFGIQAPLLIFEERLIEKGIIACYINKEGIELKDIFIKEPEPEKIESSIRLSIKELSFEKRIFFAILGFQFNPYECIRPFMLSLGIGIDFLGAGFIKKYASSNYQVTNNLIDEGLFNIIGTGLEIESKRISGFVPLGKPFTITRTTKRESIIREINARPAITIYEHYLEEKIESFKKNRLFQFYPIMFKEKNKTYLVNVIDCLEDGSLLCLGAVKENVPAQLSIFYPPVLSEEIKEKLSGDRKDGLAFIIHPITRKNILKDYAQEEIKLIKQALGNNYKTIGIGADYFLFNEKESCKIIIDGISSFISLWK